MKLAEYKDLCDREWGEACGDVQALHLTDKSHADLMDDALARGAQADTILLPQGKLFNPVTRSVVTVSGGSDQDLAEVRRHYGSATTPIPVNPERALEAVRSLGAAQRKTADDLRDAITKAREAGVTWQALAAALGDRYENVLRQYRCGSPIVVVRAWQNPKRDN